MDKSGAFHGFFSYVGESLIIKTQSIISYKQKMNNVLLNKTEIDSVDKESRIPYYLQIKKKILAAIDFNKPEPGCKINNEHELCQIFRVSRPTVRHALDELEREGFIKRIKGKGTFIADKKKNVGSIEDVINFSDEFEEKGTVLKSIILKKEVILPSNDIRLILKLEHNDKINYFERIKLLDERPFYYTKAHIPVKYCKDFLKEDFENNSSIQLIVEKYKIHIAYIKRFLEPINKNTYDKISKIVKVKNYESLYYMQTFLYKDSETIVGYYRDYLPGSKSSFRFFKELTSRSLRGH